MGIFTSRRVFFCHVWVFGFVCCRCVYVASVALGGFGERHRHFYESERNFLQGRSLEKEIQGLNTETELVLRFWKFVPWLRFTLTLCRCKAERGARMGALNSFVEWCLDLKTEILNQTNPYISMISFLPCWRYHLSKQKRYANTVGPAHIVILPLSLIKWFLTHPSFSVLNPST